MKVFDMFKVNVFSFYNLFIYLLFSLRLAGLPFRLVTNETQNPIHNLTQKLNGFGYNFDASEIIAPGPTVRKYLEKHSLRPFLLVHQSKCQ